MDNFTAQEDSSFTDPVRLEGNIESNLNKISQNTSSMSKIVKQLQTPQDSPELRDQLRKIRNYTQMLAKDTSLMVKQLISLPPDHADSNVKRNILRDHFISTVDAFQYVQRLAAQKTKDDLKRVKAQNIKPLEKPASNNDSWQPKVQQQEQMEIQNERELQELEERERDIRQLESDILDVNQIFKDLGTLIHEQGSIVDSIESSVEMTSHEVEQGAGQLMQALNSKNKARKKKMWLIIIGIIVLTIILLIFFIR